MVGSQWAKILFRFAFNGSKVLSMLAIRARERDEEGRYPLRVCLEGQGRLLGQPEKIFDSHRTPPRVEQLECQQLCSVEVCSDCCAPKNLGDTPYDGVACECLSKTPSDSQMSFAKYDAFSQSCEDLIERFLRRNRHLAP
jgi:hypothetical protein